MGIGSLIGWIIIGAIAGWLASLVMKTNAQQGLFLDIVVGIIGAFVGGFILDILDIGGTPGAPFSLYSLFTAFLGAVILLAIIKAVRRTT